MLAVTALLYFWSVERAVVVTESKSVQSKERFQRSYHNPNMIQRQSQKSDMSAFSSRLKESNDADVLLLLLLALGSVMVIYSIFSKAKEQE